MVFLFFTFKQRNLIINFYRVNLENQKLQSCYFWLAGHYKKNSKKKEAAGFFNSFIYSNRFIFQDYTRLDV